MSPCHCEAEAGNDRNHQFLFTVPESLKNVFDRRIIQ